MQPNDATLVFILTSFPLESLECIPIVPFLNAFHGILEETPMPEASIFPSFTRMLVLDHTCFTAKKPEETLQIK